MTTGIIVLLCAGIFIPVGWYMALLFVLPRLNEKDAQIDKLLHEMVLVRGRLATMNSILTWRNEPFGMSGLVDNVEEMKDLRDIINRIHAKKES